MFLNKQLSEETLNRIAGLKKDFEETNDEVDVWFTGDYYIVQTRNDDNYNVEFRWEVFDDKEFIDTFTVFCDVIIFLSNNQEC